MLFTYVNLGSAPPAFVPTDIAGCQLWLDASDTATITETAGAVSSWADKSTNAYAATQGTGAQQPTTGTRSQNGLNVLDFDGGDRLDLPSGIYSISNGPNTAFVVWATDATSSNQRLLGGYTGVDGTRYGFMLNDPAGNISVRNNSGGTSVSQAVTFNTNAHIAALRRSGGSLDNIYDGTLVNSGSGAANYTVISMHIGASSTLAFPLNGMIAEIVLYNSSLSDADANTVGNYLATKWGISWTNL